ncbi:BA14K family protein [Bosea sp. Root483D1]|nr:BA14K family protein [Bosea sp. Root483D1]
MAASAVARQNQSAWSNHVAWCSQRFRSYRASDNTWQPNNGPRRQCVSPY